MFSIMFQDINLIVIPILYYKTTLHSGIPPKQIQLKLSIIRVDDLIVRLLRYSI